MITASSQSLDSEELLHLALVDVREGKHEPAISKLKEAVAKSPEDANVHFMLAAEYAQIGLVDRAISGMTRTLELQPSLHAARFQLGLLYFSRGNISGAQEAWAELDSMGDQSAWYLVKQGLLKISANDFPAAENLLRQSLAIEHDNPALIAQTEKILASLQARIGGTKAETESAGRTSGMTHLLDRYSNSSDGPVDGE
jgi:tetratricopeptide (TPR) repeat protein